MSGSGGQGPTRDEKLVGGALSCLQLPAQGPGRIHAAVQGGVITARWVSRRETVSMEMSAPKLTAERAGGDVDKSPETCRSSPLGVQPGPGQGTEVGMNPW